MKKIFRLLFVVVLLVAVVAAAMLFSPNPTRAKWLSEYFSETLKEKNELLVYSGEITGSKTHQRNALFVGAIQEVELPYTFSFDFSVELSNAKVETDGSIIKVRVPGPKMTNHKLSILDSEVERTGALFILDSNRYTSMKLEVEKQLVEETEANEQYKADAWDVTVRNLTNLLSAVAKANTIGGGYSIQIVRDDSLAGGAPLPQTTVLIDNENQTRTAE